MSNLYYDTAAAAVAAPPLQGAVRAEVAVIGAGITGLSTAVHLAERGISVVVLDASDIGWGASGRNGGQVNPGLKLDPEVVERDFGPDLGARMNAMAGAAPDLVFALIERYGIRCEACRGGTLRAAIGRKHADLVRVSAAQYARRGAPVELLDAAAVAAMTGTHRYSSALFDRRGGALNPLRYTRGLARAALQQGASIFGASRATAMRRVAGEWQVTTPAGMVTAPQVVLATNGYTDDLWPALRRTIVPVFGAVAATAPLPNSVAAAVMPSRSVLYESGAITVYFRVAADARLIFGGRGPMREVDDTTSIRHLLDYARSLWPVLSDQAWTHAWGGQLAMTPDHYPHVHQPAAGVMICLGYNGRGVALGTAMGAQLARRLVDEHAVLDMPLSSPRTIPLHALWPLAVQAAIVKGRISDWFGR